MLAFRLCLLVSIWHAPLPVIAAHPETADGIDEHNHAGPKQDSAQPSACEFRLMLPCQLHGCGHSSLPHDESDHSCHIGSFDFGALSKSEVDLDLAAVCCGAALQSLTLMATAYHPSPPLNFGANRGAAHLAAVAPALPLRANLQVFLI
jgi:hypothetical protein